MKQMKKILSFLLVSVLLFSGIPVDVSATTTGSDTVIRVKSENVTKGEQVNVNIVIENNPGILGATFEVSYDEGLTLIDAVSGEAFSYLAMTKPGKYQSNCRFTWDAVDFEEKDIKDGTILTLTFNVDDDVETEVPLKISVSAPEGDVYDADLNYVDVTTISGSVTVLEYMLADLNGDRKVNVQDVVLLRRYLAGGYDVEINKKAANVNGDSRITSADVITIRRYLVGGYGVTPVPSPELCNHLMVATKEVNATCTEEGNVAYWYCTICKRYYTDVYGNQETTLAETIVAATGHNRDGILSAKAPSGDKPGLTEGRYCTKCEEIMEPQVEWTAGYHIIRYDVFNGDDYLATLDIENNNKTSITEGSTLYLEDLSVKGYRFLGWYDKAGDGKGNNATLIQKISNIDHNMTLYAHWEPIEYEIQYKSDLVSVESDNEMIYTVNKGKVLPSLKLDGYTFAGWTDFEGNKYTRIKPGTTGNVVLYANWLSDRNQAWTKKKLDDPIVYEDEENGLILFTYEIGEIRNVPVSEIVNFGKINESGVTKTITKKYSVTTSESMMEACSSTIAKATTDSWSWTLSKDWSDSVSVSEEFCEENGLTKTEATNLCQSETGNWYVSSSSGGSQTTSTTDSTDTYDLKTTDNNSRTWEDDYKETVKEGTDKLTYATTDKTKGIDVNGKASIGVEGEGGLLKKIFKNAKKWNLGFELGANYENKKTNKTGTETTTHGEDITTIQGTVVDDGDGSQTGKIENHTSNTEDTSSWNNETGFSKSSSVSKNEEISNTISQLISSKTGYGQSYINSEGESTTQDCTETESESQEYSSQVTFSTAKSEEEEITVTTTSTVSGYHRWIMAGTAHVFAVVGYDIATKTYFVYNFGIMDDELYQYEDYSYNSANYDDNQCSVIPFEIPHDIAEYVNSQVFATDGLEFDLNGTVTGYHGTDSAVIIPDYARISNQDGTYSVVKVTGLSPEAFGGNDFITGVRLSKYIESIPNAAFKGCKNLWEVVSSVTKIGANAFEDCPLISEWSLSSKIEYLGENAFKGAEYLILNAADKTIVQSALKSGVKNIVIGIFDMKGTLDAEILKVPDTINEFIFKGYGKTFNNLAIDSKANNTILNHVNINYDGSLPIQISSSEVGLYQMTVNANGIAALLSNQSAEVDLYGQVNLNSEVGNSLFCRNADFVQKTSGLATKINGNGDLVTCGNVTGTNYMNFRQIRKVDEATFENMLHSYTLTFDANGGTCNVSSKEVENGVAVGELPVPVKARYNFLGWYLSDGTQVTSASKFSTGEDITVYARWERMTYSVEFNANGGTVSEKLRVVSCGEAIGTLPVPERNGYDFKGWFTAANQEITAGTAHDTEETISAVAKWSVKAYTVNWNTGTGYQIKVNRTSSPNKNATTGTLSRGDSIYYGDVLSISYNATTGYSLVNQGKTSITVSGNITSSDIYATANANSYTYNINYRSTNGTNLGSTTATYKYGTTNTISAPGKSGYNTPSAQSVVWDSVSGKTITFYYEPTSLYFAQGMSGGTWRRWGTNNRYGVDYSAYTEFQNRTANSIQIRLVWTNTLDVDGVYARYGYNQYFNATIGNQSTGDVRIVSASQWSGSQYSNSSITVTSGWLTIPVSATQTSVSISARCWDDNPERGDTSWSGTVNIPAY